MLFHQMKNDELYNSIRFFLRKQVSKKDLLIIDDLEIYDRYKETVDTKDGYAAEIEQCYTFMNRLKEERK